MVSEDHGESLIGRHIGVYKILSLLGRGGMGEVYRARDTRLGRDVALKILPASFALDPERVRRFEREARLLAALNHPHIAAIYGFEESGDIHALVLELVEGPTLADRLASGPLSVREALGVAHQIAEALEAAHEKGIIHRDLKPANIKITPAGAVKVLDFGLAKAFAGDGLAIDPSQLSTITIEATRDGVIAGTPAYMSPEQARGKPLDKRTDIWAFGCVLYEMLTVRAAFGRGTLSDTISAILEREPDWSVIPPTMPATIPRLLRRCLDKDPKRRLHDIADARIEIDDALAAPVPAETPVGPRRVPLWGAAVTTILSIALATGFGIMWLRQTPPTADPMRFTLSAPEKETLVAAVGNDVVPSPYI